MRLSGFMWSLVISLLLVAQLVVAPPTPLGISGYVFGLNNINATVTLVAYSIGTQNVLDSKVTLTDSLGRYAEVLNIPEGIGYVDIYVNASNPPSYGENGNYTNISVNDNPTINITMETPLTLISPVQNALLNNNTPTFVWNYSNFSGYFKLWIDNESSFSLPLVQNITGIKQENYTLNSSQQLPDGGYYWKITAYDNSSDLDTSETRAFTIDTMPPNITSILPANDTWHSTNSISVQVTTNENAECKWDTTSGQQYASKTNTLSGTGTSHTGTLDLTSQGANIFYFQCNDTAGNVMLNDVVHLLNLDNVTPTTNYTFSYNDTWINFNANISLNATDPAPSSGLNWTKYCLGAGCSPSLGTTYTTNVTISTEGITYFRFASQDNVSNTEQTKQLIIKIDKTPPDTSDDFSYNDTWINTDAVITLTPHDPAISSGMNWTRYCISTAPTCTPDADYSSAINISSEGVRYLRYHSQDAVGNTQDIVTLTVKIDKTAPNATLASMLIEGGDVYTINTTLDFTWQGFNDSKPGIQTSGIKTYYYNFTNSEQTQQGVSDTASPGQLENAAEGTVYVYVWAEDYAGNIGLAANDSIIVDSIAPVYSEFNNNNITEDSGNENLTVYVNITETNTGLAFTPLIRYRYNDSASFTSWMNTTHVSGDTYKFDIPPPSWGWNLNRLQYVGWQYNASDVAGNNNLSQIQKELVDSIDDAPVLNPIQNQTVYEDTQLSFNISAYDVDNDGIENQTLTFSSNLSVLTITKLNATTARVTWTPDNDWVGNHSVKFTVSDGQLTDEQIITINVINVNDHPVLDPIGTLNAYENITFSYDVNATDVDVGDTLTFYDNTSLFDINPTTGLITFTPNSSQVGVYYINISVADASGAMDSEVIRLNVNDKISTITFNVRDRVRDELLNDVTLTGGATCASGCKFNKTITITENNSLIQFTFSKSGFADTVTTKNITHDATYNVTMDDNQGPYISKANIDYYLTNSSVPYYINITVNATDNFYMDNVTFYYTITPENSSYGSSVTNKTIMTNLSGGLYNAILGGYNYSVTLESNQTAYDIYGNSNTTINPTTKFILVGGNISVTVIEQTTIISGGGGGGGSSGGGGGGAAGGGFSCNATLECSEWIPMNCSRGEMQRRTCVNITKRCKTRAYIEERECICTPFWECTEWVPGECSRRGIQKRVCVDKNRCAVPPAKVESRNCTYMAPTLKPLRFEFPIIWLVVLIMVIIVLTLNHLPEEYSRKLRRMLHRTSRKLGQWRVKVYVKRKPKRRYRL